MGPAGVEYVYKDELKKIRAGRAAQLEAEIEARVSSGRQGSRPVQRPKRRSMWPLRPRRHLLAQRYEREIMNPEEALSLVLISEIVMPATCANAGYSDGVLSETLHAGTDASGSARISLIDGRE